MNQLESYFLNNKSNCIDKWHHYFDIYEFWFNQFKGKKIVILEIGVFQGGSLNMWRDYFGEKAEIYAIDINPLCKRFESENTKIFIGSQEDELFLEDVKSKMPPPDIIIDDGGHTMNQQIISFKSLYNHLKSGGIYLCEDLHTSYWVHYGGGYKEPSTFIEFTKGLIDQINAWHSREKDFNKGYYTKSIYSLHYYDSILVIEKKTDIKPPTNERTGKIIIPVEEFEVKPIKKPNQDKKSFILSIPKNFKVRVKTILGRFSKK